MNNKLLLLLLLFTLCASKAYPQFTLNGELRTRTEIRDGYRSLAEPGTTPAFLIWQRSRISFQYENEKLRFVFTPQDVRLWGNESIRSSTGVFGDEASIELSEAYAEIKITNHACISSGRQVLRYDNQRLLAARNWNNYGMSYDAVLLKLILSSWNLHLGSTWNTMAEASADNLYPNNRIKNLNFLWINGKLQEPLSLSFLHISSGITESDTVSTLHYKHTSGLYMEYKKEKLKMWAEAYYQFGKTNSGKTVSAYMFAVDASYRIGSISPRGGICYLSGNKNLAGQNTENLFDILYGARHRFYGYMDYYRNMPAHTSNGGLIDCYFSIDLKLSKAISINNNAHYFQLAQLNSSTPNSKKLGFENDLLMKYKFAPYGQLECGYLMYSPTSSIKEIQGIENATISQFFYLQLTITPTIFKQDNSHN